MPYGLKPDVVARINAIFAMQPDIEQAILYGSRAMGTYQDASDIDLTLVGKRLTLKQLLKIEHELDELMLPYKIDLSVLHMLDHPDLIDHIRRVGTVFYLSDSPDARHPG